MPQNTTLELWHQALYTDGYYIAPADEEESMKLSARNVIKGKIVDVKKGQTTAHIRLDIGGAAVTASITNEAVDELKLKAGQQAYAVIKASSIMIATD
jgi:molybdopterin-binding protein